MRLFAFEQSPIPESVKAKIRRADENIQNMSAEMDPFFKKHKYRVVRDTDCDLLEPSYRIGEPVVDPGPSLDRFSVLAGEVTYHLRSSLDQLVWQLIKRTGLSDNDILKLRPRPEFPIYRHLDEYESQGKRKVQGCVSDSAMAIINKAQPYEGKGGGWVDEAIWNVHELNIIDKHRLLNAVVGYVNVTFVFNGVQHKIRCGPIKGRTVSFSGPVEGYEMDMEADQAFHISLHEAGIMETEPIVNTLDFMLMCV